MGQPGPPPPVANPQQAQLIAQVMALTDEQIAALPPDQKVTIMQIVRLLVLLDDNGKLTLATEAASDRHEVAHQQIALNVEPSACRLHPPSDPP